MVWAVVSIVGVLVETSVIVVLGRQVTAPFEESADIGEGDDGVRR